MLQLLPVLLLQPRHFGLHGRRRLGQGRVFVVKYRRGGHLLGAAACLGLGATAARRCPSRGVARRVSVNRRGPRNRSQIARRRRGRRAEAGKVVRLPRRALLLLLGSGSNRRRSPRGLGTARSLLRPPAAAGQTGEVFLIWESAAVRPADVAARGHCNSPRHLAVPGGRRRGPPGKVVVVQSGETGVGEIRGPGRRIGPVVLIHVNAALSIMLLYVAG